MKLRYKILCGALAFAALCAWMAHPMLPGEITWSELREMGANGRNVKTPIENYAAAAVQDYVLENQNVLHEQIYTLTSPFTYGEKNYTISWMYGRLYEVDLDCGLEQWNYIPLCEQPIYTAVLLGDSLLYGAGTSSKRFWWGTLTAGQNEEALRLHFYRLDLNTKVIEEVDLKTYWDALAQVPSLYPM